MNAQNTQPCPHNKTITHPVCTECCNNQTNQALQVPQALRQFIVTPKFHGGQLIAVDEITYHNFYRTNWDVVAIR